MDEKIFHIYGAGCNRDGTGSGFAWVRLDRDKQYVEWVAGLTNHQAEYWALMSVFRCMASGSHAVIHTDSRLVCNQFSNREVRDARLHDLVFETRCLMNAKDLDVTVRWIPRKDNLARKLLDRKRKVLQDQRVDSKSVPIEGSATGSTTSARRKSKELGDI